MSSNDLKTSTNDAVDKESVESKDPDPKEQSFVSHLVELRNRLLRSLGCVFVVLICLMPFANDLYVLLAEPLLAHLPGSSSMIATHVASPFFAPFKLAIFVAVFICVPYIFYLKIMHVN